MPAAFLPVLWTHSLLGQNPRATVQQYGTVAKQLKYRMLHSSTNRMLSVRTVKGFIEGWPACTAVVLCLRREQGRTAASTHKLALALLVVEWAA